MNSREEPELDALGTELYLQLKKMASNRMKKERADHTLQPTALVHEAYLKLARNRQSSWKNKAQFLAHAANAMKQILIDHARRRLPERTWIQLDEKLEGEGNLVDFTRFGEALESLEAVYPRASRVIELRLLVGLKVDEVAEAIEMSERTVRADSKLAVAWLRRELGVA